MPSLGVSTNSPIYNNLAAFLRQMIENGILPSYIQLINSFFVASIEPDMVDQKRTPDVMDAGLILKYFLVSFVIQMMVFIGELLCHRWQVRRV